MGDPAGRVFGQDRAGRDIARPLLEKDDIGWHFGNHRTHWRGEQTGQRVAYFLDAAAANRDGLDHRHPQFLGEPFDIKAKAIALGHVDHVEGDDCRNAQLEYLEGEAQMVVEV